MEKIQLLLDKIYQNYLYYEEEIQKNGERFNIFNILQLSTEEVRLHSFFIRELLDPYGTHGLKDFFLKAFITHLVQKEKDIYKNLKYFSTGKAHAAAEYYIGMTDLESTEGGRIDIIVRDHNLSIIIENKIHAKDQKNQLIRYNKIGNKAALIYLTLHGTAPSIVSAGNLLLDHDYICLSYNEDILQWLENCLMEKATMPLAVRYSLIQYITLIKQITAQQTLSDMERNITELLTDNDENIITAHLIAHHWEQITDVRAASILNCLVEELRHYEIRYQMAPKFNIYPRVEIYPDGWHNHLIGFTEERGFLYGIKRVNERNKPIAFPEIKASFDSQFKTADWWLCYSFLHGEIFDSNTVNPWLQRNERHIAKSMAEKIELLIKVQLTYPDLNW